MMRRVLIMLAFVLLGLVLAPAASALPVARTPAENKAAAEADAQGLLGFVSLPPSATPEAAHAQEGPPFVPATPNLVDAHALWIVPGPPSEVLRWVRTHLPTEARSSTRESTPELVEGFSWPPVHEVLGERELLLSAERLPNGSTELDAWAEVVWITPRSLTEMIPAGARLLRIVEHQGIRHTTKRKPIIITAPKKITLVTELLNALPVSQPGTYSCPSDEGDYITITFYKRSGGKPFATAKAYRGGCGSIGLTIDGKGEPPLEEADGLIRRIEHGLHLQLLPRR